MSVNHKKALDAAKNGNWEEAHNLVQNESDRLSNIIHGYLHRVEGDEFNAGYWYNRANEAMLDNSLEEELERLYGLLPES